MFVFKYATELSFVIITFEPPICKHSVWTRKWNF